MPEYPIIEMQPDWVLEPEGMGSKQKFWYRAIEKGPDWLFKYPQANTGQHWAEKIAAEVAARMDIFHARVELAGFAGDRGSASESFARHGRNLFHGNQILAGKVLGYNPSKQFRQSDHTLDNILSALDQTFLTPEGKRRARAYMADYLLLDAVIGNTDRHHENWGILRQRKEERWQGIVAPTFDHASSLGRELVDVSNGKCRDRLLKERRVAAYVEKAPGAIFWINEDKKGLSPLELVRRASKLHPEMFQPSLARVDRLKRDTLEDIVSRVPVDWMSSLAREFAVEMMVYAVEELTKLKP